MLAYKGELEKTVTFKEKVRQHPDNVNAGLLDLSGFAGGGYSDPSCSKCPGGQRPGTTFGNDQEFCQRFNNRYGDVFPEPQAFNYGRELIKILGLDGAGKMSKSENQNATFYLSDDDELIRKKVMKAKTDSGPTEPIRKKPDYIENLFALMKMVS